MSIGNGVKMISAGSPGAIITDVWGRQKVVFDKSLYKSKFTKNIPDKDWVLPVTTNLDGTVVSQNGQLVMDSGTSSGAYGLLSSRRHPTYQANRGHLYSTALILPEPEKIGFTRRWGIYYEDAGYQTGYLFDLTDGVLKGRQITTYNSVKKEATPVIIDYTPYLDSNGTLDALFDLAFQWRGVGDPFYFMNQKLAGTISNLGSADPDNKVSVIDPSLPIRFECINNGTGTGSAKIICGCVDISSEGGGIVNRRLQSIESAATLSIGGTEAPALIAYIPSVYSSQHNSRDSLVQKISISTDTKAFIRIYSTRDNTAFGAVAAGDINGDTHFTFANLSQSSIKYYNAFSAASPFVPSKASFIDGARLEIGGTYSFLFDREDEDVVASHGDYIIATVENATGGTTDCHVTMRFGEEI